MSATHLWIWAAAGPAALLFFETLCLWPGPRGGLFEAIAFPCVFFSPFIMLALLFALPLAMWYLFAGLASWRDRKRMSRNLWRCLPCLCALVAGYFALGTSVRSRHAAFERAAGIGDQIVSAIDQFTIDHEACPSSLADLVPKYSQAIPYTGMLGYPEFYYCRHGDERCRIDGDAAYELGIRCPSGGINFDRFFFWPKQDYPNYIYSGGVERIGRWAYVHE